MILFRCTTVLLIVGLLSTMAIAENWPRFRGPNGEGIAQNAEIPAAWSDSDYAWNIDLPGEGNSSPIVWDGTVYITAANENAGTFTLLAVSASNGDAEWKREYAFKPTRVNPLNGYATSTPAADESGVYVLWFGDGQTFAAGIAHDGAELWKRDLGGMTTLHGAALSPMVYEGKLIFTLEQEGARATQSSAWLALDCATGDTVWRLERDLHAKASSSVPCVYRNENGTDWLIFNSCAHGISAVDPNDGTVMWEQKDALPFRVIGSPVVANDLIIVTCGQRGGGLRMLAVRPSGEGAVEIVYDIEDDFVPYVPTSVANGNLLFMFHDRGSVACMNVETGELLWNERARGKFLGSPVLAGGRLYCATEQGRVIVIDASTEFEKLAENDLGEASEATPAVADGRMFLRTKTKLMCVAAPNAK